MKYYKVPSFLYEPMLGYIGSKPSAEVGKLYLTLVESGMVIEEEIPDEVQENVGAEEKPDKKRKGE